MARINQSVEQILQHIRPDTGTDNRSGLLQTDGPEASTTPTTDQAQLWQASQQLPEIPPFTPPAPMENLTSPSSTMPPPTVMAEHLPSGDILRQLVDLFFEHIHPLIPMFHKPGFINNLFSQERQVLLHGIVVVSFRFWQAPTPSVGVRDAYVKTSREHLLLAVVDTSSLLTTQALALLALDAIGQGPGPRTLNIMAMLISAAQQLRLARVSSSSNGETSTSLVRNEDSDDDVDVSSINSEEKCRLFWAIYMLDRFSSVSHGQSASIDTKNIKLPYPASDENWGQTTTPEWFQFASTSRTMRSHCSNNIWHHYIDLLELLNRSNQLLVQPINLSLPANCQEWQSNFRRLDVNLSTWHENLPREVRDPQGTFHPMWVMVQATFHL